MIIKTEQPKKFYKSNQLIDFHIHTTFSDGKYSLEEVLQEAERRGVEVLSITDHHTAKAYDYIFKNDVSKLYFGKILVGTELNVMFGQYPIEVLAYNFDVNKVKDEFWMSDNFFASVQKTKLNKLLPIADKFGLKYDMENLSHPTKNTAIQFFDEILRHPDNAWFDKKYKINKGYSVYRKQFYNPKGMFHSDLSDLYPQIGEIKKVINDAGGVVVLAHGFNVYGYSNEAKIVKTLAKLKLIDGIECIHRRFERKDVKRALKIAKKYGLIVTGGSDSHDIVKHVLGYSKMADMEIRFK